MDQSARCARWRPNSGLAVADKPDSQDICFVPEGRYAAVVEKLRPGAAEPGEIVDLDGRVLGRHDGIIHFTVGQRRGLKLSGAANPCSWCVERRRGARSWWARARRCSAVGLRSRRSIWLADADFVAAARREAVPVRVKVRSTRAPKPALLRLLEGARAEVIFPMARKASRPARLASSMMTARAFWAAASSPSRHGSEPPAWQRRASSRSRWPRHGPGIGLP